MSDVIFLENVPAIAETSPGCEVATRTGSFRRVRAAVRGLASAVDWLFGVASLLLGLSILAALPIAQFLSLGYLLEASGRVARTGRIRDGLIGVRRAARVGGMIAGMWLLLWPAWFVQSLAGSAELIDPSGPIARGWRTATIVVIVATLAHLFIACVRGGRLRHFLWPIGSLAWLARRSRRRGWYVQARDGLWNFVSSLHLPHYFRVGLIGFLGTLAWIIPPAVLIASGSKVPLLGVLGAVLLAVIVPFLPFLQIRYAVEGRVSAMFSRRAIRDQFRRTRGRSRSPWRSCSWRQSPCTFSRSR